MNLETQGMNPNVTQIPVQEYPPQGEQQYGVVPQDAQESYAQENIAAPQNSETERHDVPLDEGSEHEHQIDSEATAADTFSESEATTTPPADEYAAPPTEQTEEQPQEDVDAGRWDHDKAETLAHVLQSTDEGKKIIESAQENSREAQRIRGEKTPTESLGDAEQYRKKLAREDLSDADREYYKRLLGREEHEIARERARTERAATEREELSSHSADQQLAIAEQFYDKNPEYAAGLSTEAFMQEVGKFTDIKAYFYKVEKEQSHINSILAGLNRLDEDKNAYDLTSSNNGRHYYEMALRQLYFMQDHNGLTVEERSTAVEALVATFNEQTDPYTYSGAEAVKNMRAIIDQFVPAFKTRAENAMTAVRGALESVKNGTPITPIENVDVAAQQ